MFCVKVLTILIFICLFIIDIEAKWCRCDINHFGLGQNVQDTTKCCNENGGKIIYVFGFIRCELGNIDKNGRQKYINCCDKQPNARSSPCKCDFFESFGDNTCS
jgi:hypothetical protein